MGKEIVLITGAGRRQGLGFASAKEFGKLGYHVIITARKLEQVLLFHFLCFHTL